MVEVAVKASVDLATLEQRSHQGFSANLRKKNSAKYRKVLHSHISIFKWLEKEIFFNQAKFKTSTIDLLTKLPLKKLKIVRQNISAPFLPLLVKMGAVRPPIFLGQKIFLGAPFELFCRIFGHLTTVTGGEGGGVGGGLLIAHPR